MNPKVTIARRAALEIQDGNVVNLGIGIPLLVADFLKDKPAVSLHTENGLLGMGSPQNPAQLDPQIVNAAKMPVSERPGASYFDSAASFAMIRGGHVDVALLGALEVDQFGRVANWTVPGAAVMGVGGAMDLLVGARMVVVLLTHCTRDGRSKIVPECALPLTGTRPADVIITELGVFHVCDGGLELVEIQEGATIERINEATAAPFRVAAALLEMQSGREVEDAGRSAG